MSENDAVRRYWSEEPCGTRGVDRTDRVRFFTEIELQRYEWEPYIKEFACFTESRGLDVLEIGVGAGTDFVNWVRHDAHAIGMDLTESSIRLTRERLELEGRHAETYVGDAENLPLKSNHFDLVYSYGVLHHSTNPQRAISEVARVLKNGGKARIMIYHRRSWVGLILWTVHCLLKLRPWKSPKWAIANYLESPGTSAYSRAEGHALFSEFKSVRIRTQLCHGDLLLMPPGKKYMRWYHRLAWAAYPRWLIRLSGNRFGLGMMIEAVK
jgi:SAM-dependent methyltransferase